MESCVRTMEPLWVVQIHSIAFVLMGLLGTDVRQLIPVKMILARTMEFAKLWETLSSVTAQVALQETNVRPTLMTVRVSFVRTMDLARMELTPTLVNVWMGSQEIHVRITLMTVRMSPVRMVEPAGWSELLLLWMCGWVHWKYMSE